MKKKNLAVAIGLSLCLASMLVLPSCARAQDKDTLDTKVVADGNIITLSWDKKHPWDADLLAHGVSLVAEYKTKSNGVVAQRLQAAAATGPNNRFIHFRLPNLLTAAPQGAVCLYFQLPNQKLLPVRKAGPQVFDTVRIRYQPWENIAARNSQEKSHEAQLAAIKHAIDAKTAEIDIAEKAFKAKAWTSADSCQKIPVPQFAPDHRPFDVVDLTKQEDVARRICVSRVKWAADSLYKYEPSEKEIKDHNNNKAAAIVDNYGDTLLQELVLSADQLASILQASKQDVNDADFKQRQQQLNQFRTDWTRWAPQADNYTPELGGKTWPDIPGLQSYFAENCGKDPEACFRLISFIAVHSGNPFSLPAQPSPSNEVILGYIGGAIESYSRCVVDDQKELKTKYDSWQQLQHNAPALAEQAHTELVTACQRQFSTLDKLRADKISLETQFQQASQAAQDNSDVTNTATQNLNASVCQRPQ